jgi:hypothetical protein
LTVLFAGGRLARPPVSFFKRGIVMSKPGSPSAVSAAQIWEKRTQLVKQEMAAESAANDAKTARLRALRLEKEAAEARLAEKDDDAAPVPKKRAVRRIVIS